MPSDWKHESILKSWWLILKAGHWWKWEPLRGQKKIPFTDLMKNKDESPRFLGIWLAVRVGHSLTKTGHPKETHNKKIWGKLSKYLHNKVWNAKKMQVPYMYNRSVQLKALKNHWNVWLRQTGFVCWKFRGRRSIILISTDAMQQNGKSASQQTGQPHQWHWLGRVETYGSTELW